MAVSVQAPFYSDSGMWNLGESAAAISSTSSQGIPAPIPSYQYPLANHPGLDASSNILPRFQQLDASNPLPASAGLPTKTDSPILKRRAIPVNAKYANVKRSMSTPNVRGQAAADALAMSADKRRNKLGYHRSSVACGHCRRRKIRCIPAAGDAAKRCSNCIRLKKECTFFPVDQAPPPSGHRDSKAQSGHEGASEAASSPTLSAQHSDMPAMPQGGWIPPIQDLGVKKQKTGSYSPEYKIGYADSQLPWNAPDAAPMVKPVVDVSQAYWHGNQNPQDSPIHSGVYTPGLPPQQSHWPPQSQAEDSAREATWSGAPPPPSQYSNMESLHQQAYGQYSQPPVQPSESHYSKARIPQAHSSSMYPPHIQTTGHPISSAPVSSMDTSHPGYSARSATSVHSLPLPSFGNWQYGQHGRASASAGAEMHGGWNPSPAGQRQQQMPGDGYGGHSGPFDSFADPGHSYYPPPPPHGGR